MNAIRDEVGGVLDSLAQELAANARTADLVASVPLDDDSPLRIALVGPFNAGKTMLVAALLELPLADVDALTAATPKTAGVTPYRWRDHVLLDLPGTLSGLDAHDHEARRGVRLADVLVIVTTVELPGEDETEQILSLLGGDGFRGRALVVVNKMSSEQSEAAVVEAEIRRRLGPENAGVPVVFTDARDLVDAATFPDLPQEDRAVLRDDSGIATLVAELDRLVGQGEPRLVALCWESARVASDGLARWRPTPEEEAQTSAARRLEDALRDAIEELRSARDSALKALVSEIHACGAVLAARVDEADGHLPQEAVNEAEKREEEARRRFATSLSVGAQPILDKLGEQFSTAAGPQQEYQAQERQASVGAEQKQPSAQRDGIADRLADRLFTGIEQKVATELRKFGKQGADPGTPAHKTARKINNLLGVKAKPYTHVNRAKQLSKGAKLGGKALQFLGPVLDLKGGVDDLLHSTKIDGRRREIRSMYQGEAAETERTERTASDMYITDLLAPFREAAEPILQTEQQLAASRAAAEPALQAIRVGAVDLAGRLGCP